MTVFKTKNNLKRGLVGLALAFSLATATVSADSYTVQAGDTLSQIAAAKQTTVEQLAVWNHLTNVNLIHVGQILELSADIKAEDTAVGSSTATTTSNTYQSNLSEADAAAKEIIAFKESSGSYTAQNGQYYGRYQLSLSYLNGDLSPENQERVADEYVNQRYGSWSQALVFWNANGWY